MDLNQILLAAAQRGDVDACREAIIRGAAVDSANLHAFGGTSLHWAARNGHLACVHLLLDRGANPNAREPMFGGTPLHSAVSRGFLYVAALLLECGADVEARALDLQTPLHRAAYNGHDDIVRGLLRRGAKSNVADKDGYTPLHMSTSKGFEAVARLLLEHGADLTARTKLGETALELGRRNATAALLGQPGQPGLCAILQIQAAHAAATSEAKAAERSRQHAEAQAVVEQAEAAVVLAGADAAAAAAAAEAEAANQEAAEAAGKGLTAAAMADGGSPCELSVSYLRACTGDFAADRALGAPGAFGTVFCGTDAALGVRFAVKRLSNTAPWPAERSAEREIAILSRFRHPHIIRLWGFTTTPTERCLVYELGEGGALSENLCDDARAARLTWRTRCRIAAGIAAALNYLHRSGETPAWHRDVKAANVVLTAALEPKLIDCGISKLLTADEAARGAVTATGALAFGTAGYMCPAYTKRHKYDEKAEVYSFGVLLCELLTGKLQLGGDGRGIDLVDEVVEEEEEGGLASHWDTRPPPWEAKAQAQLQMLAEQCVQRKPDKRPPFPVVHQQLNALRLAHCTATAEEALQEAELATLRRDRDALLLERAAAAQQQGPPRECCIYTACPERPLTLADGFECEAGHFVCAECMAAAVDSRADAAGRLGCLCCGAGPFSDRALVLGLSERAGLKYLHQVQRQAEAEAARQLEAEFEARVAAAVHQRLAEDGVSALRRRVINDILTLCCPVCRKAMPDFMEDFGRRKLPFEGCFAVHCKDSVGHGCRSHFCGWCFEAFPAGNGGDRRCHAHVRACVHNQAPGKDLFGGPNAEALFTASLRNHRCRALDRLLTTEVPEAQRAPLLASLQRELADTGLIASNVALAPLRASSAAPCLAPPLPAAAGTPGPVLPPWAGQGVNPAGGFAFNFAPGQPW